MLALLGAASGVWLWWILSLMYLISGGWSEARATCPSSNLWAVLLACNAVTGLGSAAAVRVAVDAHGGTPLPGSDLTRNQKIALLASMALLWIVMTFASGWASLGECVRTQMSHHHQRVALLVWFVAQCVSLTVAGALAGLLLLRKRRALARVDSPYGFSTQRSALSSSPIDMMDL